MKQLQASLILLFSLSASAQTTLESYEANLDQYITNQKVQTEIRETTVESEIPNLLDGTGWDYFRGATAAEIEEARTSDREIITGDDFPMCQGAVPHEYDDIMTPATVTYGDCYEYHEYEGTASGLCIKVITTIVGCDVYIILADLVEYGFPSYVFDQSEQPFQSPYYSKSLVNNNLNQIENWYANAGATAKKTIEDVSKIADKEDVAYGHTPSTEAITITADQEIVDIIKARFTKTQRHFAPHASKSYGRVIPEPLNYNVANSKDFIPHIGKENLFGTDLKKGHLYSKVFGKSIIDEDKMDLLKASLGTRRCIRNNKNDGKTPTDLDEFLSAVNDDSGLCFDKIGEIFPFTAHRRPHITDATYQGALRALNLFHILYSDSGSAESAERHTFLRDIDKWTPLRNDAFRAENPHCKPIDDMPLVNKEYFSANSKEIKKGGNNSLSLYTVFKGCWNFKGKDEDYWTKIDEYSGLTDVPWKLRLH